MLRLANIMAIETRTRVNIITCLFLLTLAVLLLVVLPSISSGNTGATLKGAPSSWSVIDRYQEWLLTFKAADPAFQQYCMDVLTSSKRFDHMGAQYSQDVSLFHNFFKAWPLQGKQGFYVESGANDPLKLSNTLFFDKCLGWSGLCIEPQPEYHEPIRRKRSCILVPECISAKKETMMMSAQGANSAVNQAGGVSVQCAPLHDIMLRYAGNKHKNIDLWVLDVEGFELNVLRATNFTEVSVEVMLIEYLWLPQFPPELDILMSQRSFIKHHQLVIDSIFIQRGSMLMTDGPTWYPPQFDADLELNRQWALEKGVQNQFRAAWGLA